MGRMDKLYVDRVQRAVTKYIEKNDPNRPKRSHGNPEKKTEKEILEYCRAKGWDLTVIEAKATYNEKTRRYTGSSVVPGFPDCVGNMSTGLAVYIEFKAKNRRSTIRDNQREFLVRKIKTGAFGICSDSVRHFDRIYTRWIVLRRVSLEESITYLLSELPKSKT